MAVAGNLALLALKNGNDGKPNKTETIDDKAVLWPDLSPLDLPRLKLYVKNVEIDNTNFGETRVDADALPGGWQLSRLSLTHGALTGHANARWTRVDGVTRAKASASLDGHGLARLLRTISYASPLRARSARVHTTLTIAPNRNGLDLHALDGQFDLALDHGTLLSVDPGAGRLLGLFNLYVLPRRLRMDFRDVTHKGTAFDKVRAHFNIRNGNAYSKNVQIKLPSATVDITGRIGIAARDYDEHVVITPELGSGVAIASAVIGGPLVGAAVFAVQELLKKPIQKFSSIGYTLKGSWDNPTIAEPNAHE